MLSDLYNLVLRATRLPALRRRRQQGAIVLCYHNVVQHRGTGGDPGLHLSSADFTRQMRWISGHYDVVSLRELADRLIGGRAVSGTAAVTFDDAYRGVFDHAWPVLREVGLPATVFVPTGLVDLGEGFWWDHPSVTAGATAERRDAFLAEYRGDTHLIAEAAYGQAQRNTPDSHRPARWSTIARAASEGLDLGIHSASHRNLTRVDDDDFAEELTASRARLLAETGVLAESFAYPYGLFDARVRDAVRRAGYRVGLTVDYGMNELGGDPWALRRINIPASISAAAFEVWLAGLRPQFRRR